MTYTKPEVVVLGEAASLIQIPSQKVQSGSDNTLTVNPAYDLDE